MYSLFILRINFNQIFLEFTGIEGGFSDVNLIGMSILHLSLLIKKNICFFFKFSTFTTSTTFTSLQPHYPTKSLQPLQVLYHHHYDHYRSTTTRMCLNLKTWSIIMSITHKWLIQLCNKSQTKKITLCCTTLFYAI